MRPNGKKIIYFVNGSSPTEEQFKEAELLGTSIFRNAKFIADEPLENCDGVAGEVPGRYLEAFPKVTPVGQAVKTEINVTEPKAKEQVNFKPTAKTKVEWQNNA